MGDPLTLEGKLKDPEFNNWLKAVLILRQLKVGISSFVEVRCRQAQEDVIQTVQNSLPPLTAVPQCTTCTRDSLQRNIACPQNICPFILQEINKIHRNKHIQLSCTDVSAWTDTSHCWEFAKTFIMGEGYGDKRNAADTDCAGLLSIIINCVWIHNSLTTDMKITSTVFHKVKNLRNDMMHSPDNRLSHALLQDLIKACLQILDDPKILAADQTAIAARERIKEIEGMLLTVSNVDYLSVFMELKEYLRQEISDLVGKQASQEEDISNLVGKQASQEEAISDLARQHALQVNELQGRVGVLERYIEKLQTTQLDSMDQLGAAELKADILKGYQMDFDTVMETSLYDGVSAIHMFSPIIIREDLENQFSDNSPVRQGTSAAPAFPISQYSGKVKHIESYRDIFFKDKQLQRRIVILGEAGMGKTTFCNHIVNLWCLVHTDDCQRDFTEHDQALIGVLKQFEYLFIVRCRDTKDHISVLSMIKEMFCSEKDEKHIDNIFRYKTKQCLVIIDGLDEWLYTSSVGRGKDSLHVLPDCTTIRGATVLMTSRPWKVELLPRNSLLGYSVLQIEGLDWDDIHNLILKCIQALEPSVKDHASLCERCVEQIAEQEMEEVVQHPLLLFSIIESWLSRNHNLHRSLNMNYAAMINSVVSHSDDKLSDKDKRIAERQSKQSLPGCFSEMKACLTHSGIIRKMSALAFNTLVLKEKKRSLVFSKKDLIDDVGEDCLDLCLKLGILSETKASSLARVKHVTISFIHKSIQEYFASLHLSEDESGLTEFTDKLTSLNEVFDLALILIFLFGMSPSKGQRVLKHVNGVVDQCPEIKAYRRQCDYYTTQSPEGTYIIRRLNQLYIRCAIELKHTVVSPTSQHTSIQPDVYIHDVLIDDNRPDDELNLMFCPGEPNIKSLAYAHGRTTPSHVVESLESMTNLEKLVVVLSKDHLDKHIDLIIQSLPHLQQLQSFKISISQEWKTYSLSVLQTKSLLTELSKLTNLVSVSLSWLDLATVEKVEFPTNLHSVFLSKMNVTSELFACLPSSCTAVNFEDLNCTGDLVFPSTCSTLYCYSVSCTGDLVFPSTCITLHCREVYCKGDLVFPSTCITLHCRDVSCKGELVFPSTCIKLRCRDVSCTGNLVFPSTCTTLICSQVSYTGDLVFPSTCTTLDCIDVSCTGYLDFPFVCTTLNLNRMSLSDLAVLPANLTSLVMVDVTLTQAAEEQLWRGLRSTTTLQSLCFYRDLRQELYLHEHIDLTSCLSLYTLELYNIKLDNCGVVVPQNVRNIRMWNVTLSQQYWDQLVHTIYTCHNVSVRLLYVTINEATMKYIRQHFIVTYEAVHQGKSNLTEEEEPYITDGKNDRTDEKNSDRTGEKENDRTDEKENDRTDEKNSDRTDEKETDRTDEKENDITDEENDRTDATNNDRTDEENIDRTCEKNNDRTDEENIDRTDEENDRTDATNNDRTDKKNNDRTDEENSERTDEKDYNGTDEENGCTTVMLDELQFYTKCPGN